FGLVWRRFCRAVAAGVVVVSTVSALAQRGWRVLLCVEPGLVAIAILVAAAGRSNRTRTHDGLYPRASQSVSDGCRVHANARLDARLLASAGQRLVDGRAGAPGLCDVGRSARRARCGRQRYECAEKSRVFPGPRARWRALGAVEFRLAVAVRRRAQAQLRFLASRLVSQGGKRAAGRDLSKSPWACHNCEPTGSAAAGFDTAGALLAGCALKNGNESRSL